LVPSGYRQRLDAGAFWGAHTGPNPTDRGKKGCKRHVIVDARGLPLAVHTGPANQRDDQAAPATIKAIPRVIGADGKMRRPEVLQGDRGYGFAWLLLLLARWLIRPLIAPRGSPHGSGLGRTRYVVERTLSWIGHYRRVRCCYEKTGEHFQAFHTLMVCAILARRLHSVRRRSRVLK
jgi:transposase